SGRRAARSPFRVECSAMSLGQEQHECAAYPLTLSSPTKATPFRIMPWRCSARFEHRIARRERVICGGEYFPSKAARTRRVCGRTGVAFLAGPRRPETARGQRLRQGGRSEVGARRTRAVGRAAILWPLRTPLATRAVSTGRKSMPEELDAVVDVGRTQHERRYTNRHR